MILGITPKNSGIDVRHELYERCDCKHTYRTTLTQYGKGQGRKPTKTLNSCDSQNKWSHVCTKESKHTGNHHSHAGPNMLFSEWCSVCGGDMCQGSFQHVCEHKNKLWHKQKEKLDA